jgi:DNA-binding response OmpR family regulator
MQQYELVEMILDAFAELATLHAAAAAAAEQAWSVLVEHDETDWRPQLCDRCQYRRLSSCRPRVDAVAFSVEWRGQCCDLGPSILFRLIQRLLRRPDRYYPYDILMDDVWQRRCSNTTVRSAVTRLRQALCDAGMSDLAGAIKGRGQCYGVFLNGGGQ